jgi:hypothetical protein
VFYFHIGYVFNLNERNINHKLLMRCYPYVVLSGGHFFGDNFKHEFVSFFLRPDRYRDPAFDINFSA